MILFVLVVELVGIRLFANRSRRGPRSIRIAENPSRKE
jgi:hypothetical protein